MRFLNNGKLCINGFSIPENSMELYSQPMKWLKDLKKTDPIPIELDLKFDFLDSSSTRSVADMLKILNELRNKNFDHITVNWFYERYDNDMKETGEDLNSITKGKVEFNIIEKKIDDLEY